MNPTPLHPMVVHMPMALCILVPIVMGAILAAWSRNLLPKNSWAIVVLLQLILVSSGAFAMNTGEADEDRVEPVVGEAILEAHEESAEVFLWAAGLVAVLSIIPLVQRKEKVARMTASLALIGGCVTLGLGYRVGSRGGELVYSHGAASVYAGSEQPGAPRPPLRGHHEGGGHDEHDDD